MQPPFAPEVAHGRPLTALATEPVACTFDDVLLLPGASSVLPHQVDLASTLGRGTQLSLPFCAAAMDTVTEAAMAVAMAQAGGLGVIHKNATAQAQADHVAAARQQAGKAAPIAAATGVGEAGVQRAHALVTAGATILVVDTAHGHAQGVIDTVRALRTHFSALLLMAGNVATAAGAAALLSAGADVIKVGMGPGSICTTRSVSGVGVPQLTALTWVAAAIYEARQTGRRAAMVADGGIRTSGDVVKAMACGADAVMLGRLLAGADEAPGQTVTLAGARRKQYRGMGSLAAMRLGSAERYAQGPSVGGSSEKWVAEGVEATVPATGPVADTLAQLAGGLRAGMGYVGAPDLMALSRLARYVRQSPAGMVESGVHDVRVDAGHAS